MFLRLLSDTSVQGSWFLDAPVNAQGDEWAFWRLLDGKPVDGDDLDTWKAAVKRVGTPMPFSFSGFDVPVINRQVATVFRQDAPADHQLLPLEIEGDSVSYQLLVITRTINCVDEQRSEFTRWSHEDGRPDKTGTYRMFTRLRLNAGAIPETTHAFRVSGWEGAIVVSERFAERLQKCVATGVVYESVA